MIKSVLYSKQLTKTLVALWPMRASHWGLWSWGTKDWLELDASKAGLDLTRTKSPEQVIKPILSSAEHILIAYNDLEDGVWLGAAKSDQPFEGRNDFPKWVHRPRTIWERLLEG
jgi:hypothetical protein